MDFAPPWLTFCGTLILAIPFVFGLAASFVHRDAPFRAAIVGSALAFSCAVAAAIGIAVLQPDSQLWTTVVVRLDLITASAMTLVCGLGLVIVRYSRTYLSGDLNQVRYARWLLATLAATTTLIMANNLLIMAIAWTATSLTLHQLLTLYAERPAALLAAHKKFLVSRLADLFLWLAIVLIYLSVGSLDLSALAAWSKSTSQIPLEAEVAAVLFVISVALRSAQLPFHGWLTQVMEAPTPVSALLHAGIINIGGFLMIRLAPLMAHAEAAQLLLIIIGATTTVVAALVMTTRVSIKVSLAWSTCAQMGFMLVQCGLGAWHLALLHLLAHSLYKAHAFLSSGSTVERWRTGTMSSARQPISFQRWALTSGALLTGTAVIFAIMETMGAGSMTNSPEIILFSCFLTLSLTPMFLRGWEGTSGMVRVLLVSGGVATLYFGGHAIAAHLVPLPSSRSPDALAWAIVALGLLVIFAVQSLILVRPNGRLAAWLHPRLFSGLHLDEFFTKLTFRWWPPRFPARNRSTQSLPIRESLEA